MGEAPLIRAPPPRTSRVSGRIPEPPASQGRTVKPGRPTRPTPGRVDEWQGEHPGGSVWSSAVPRLVGGVATRAGETALDTAVAIARGKASRTSLAVTTATVIHGTNDTMAPAAEARLLVERLRETPKRTVVYAELPGAQHAFDFLPSIRTRLTSSAPSSATSLGTATAPSARPWSRRPSTRDGTSRKCPGVDSTRAGKTTQLWALSQAIRSAVTSSRLVSLKIS